jgi:hypothetical protein
MASGVPAAARRSLKPDHRGTGWPSWSPPSCTQRADPARDIADAHVIAVCPAVDAAVVVTSDPDDITLLAAAVPGTRVIARRPQDITAGR